MAALTAPPEQNGSDWYESLQQLPSSQGAGCLVLRAEPFKSQLLEILKVQGFQPRDAFGSHICLPKGKYLITTRHQLPKPGGTHHRLCADRFNRTLRGRPGTVEAAGSLANCRWAARGGWGAGVWGGGRADGGAAVCRRSGWTVGERGGVGPLSPPQRPGQLRITTSLPARGSRPIGCRQPSLHACAARNPQSPRKCGALSVHQRLFQTLLNPMPQNRCQVLLDDLREVIRRQQKPARSNARQRTSCAAGQGRGTADTPS